MVQGRLNAKGCKKVATELKKIISFVYTEFVNRLSESEADELCESIELSKFELELKDALNYESELTALKELRVDDTAHFVMPVITIYFKNKAGDTWLEANTAEITQKIAKTVEYDAAATCDNIISINISRGTRPSNTKGRRFFLDIRLKLPLDDTIQNMN